MKEPERALRECVLRRMRSSPQDAAFCVRFVTQLSNTKVHISACFAQVSWCVLQNVCTRMGFRLRVPFICTHMRMPSYAPIRTRLVTPSTTECSLQLYSDVVDGDGGSAWLQGCLANTAASAGVFVTEVLRALKVRVRLGFCMLASATARNLARMELCTFV